MNARTLPWDRNAQAIVEEAKQGIRDDLAKIKARIEAHDQARTEELHEAIDNGDFDPASYTYSIHTVRTSCAAKCGCVARQEEQCDGDSVWLEWMWSDSKCMEEV